MLSMIHASDRVVFTQKKTILWAGTWTQHAAGEEEYVSADVFVKLNVYNHSVQAQW